MKNNLFSKQSVQYLLFRNVLQIVSVGDTWHTHLLQNPISVSLGSLQEHVRSFRVCLSYVAAPVYLSMVTIVLLSTFKVNTES